MALIQSDVNMALKFVVTKSFKEFTEYSNIPANIRLDQDEYVRLSLTSSRRFENVFKTFSRHIIELKCSWKHNFKTSSRRIQNVSEMYC